MVADIYELSQVCFSALAKCQQIYENETDHAGRKTKFSHTLNGTLKNVAKYEYDPTGRLITDRKSVV